MNIFNKTLYLFVLPFLIANCATNAMEYEQLQLEVPKKQIDIIRNIKCSIMIPKTEQAVSYAMKTVHVAIFEHSNLQSTIKDPVMLFLIKRDSTRNQFYVPLPAKLFINCTDGSIIHLYETDGSKLFQRSHPIFKKKQLHVIAVCKKNPNLNDSSFAEQFNNAMNKFYKNPGIPWQDEEHQDELEIAGVMIPRALPSPIIMHGPYGPFIAYEIVSEHGPNGCSNEQTLIKSVIDEQVSTTKNILTSLMNREMTGSFKK